MINAIERSQLARDPLLRAELVPRGDVDEVGRPAGGRGDPP